MSAARNTAPRARRLVLVRGGLDDAGHGGGDDWEDFCRRIGWQTAEPELDDDFERRIAEGLVSRPIVVDNVVDLEAARRVASTPLDDDMPDSFVREIRRSFVREAQASSAGLILRDAHASSAGLIFSGSGDDGAADLIAATGAARSEDAAEAQLAPDAAGDRLRFGLSRAATQAPWVRRAGFAALAIAAAAAAALAITRTPVFSAPSQAASIAAATAEVAQVSTASPRAVDAARIEAPLPSKVGPVRATPPEDKTAKPAPGPTAPRDVRQTAPRDAKTEPPGMLVARSGEDDARDVQQAIPRDVRQAVPRDDASGNEASPSEGRTALDAETRPVVAVLDAPGAGRIEASAPNVAWPAATGRNEPAVPWGAGASYRVSLSAGDVAPPATARPGADVWSNGAPAADPPAAERTRPASWSLSGGADRWVGASLAPQPPPAYSPASFGVMVQVDVAKALGKL